MSVAIRLREQIRATAPAVADVSVGAFGVAATVRVQPPGQQAAAQPAIDAFDWSAAAQAAWEDDQKPERKSLRQAAAQALADNAAFLAVASPSNAQTLAQVKALTRQVNRIIPRLTQLD